MGLRVSDRARASGSRGAHAGSVLLRGPAEEAGARASGEASQGAGRWARRDEERASDADSGGSGSGRARGWAKARAEGGGADGAWCWAGRGALVRGELGPGCCWAKNRERPGWVIGLGCCWVWGLLDFLLFYSFPFQTNST